jgi:hypothetical protein
MGVPDVDVKLDAENSCGPQLLESVEPDDDWNVDRLGRYAKRQHEAILKEEHAIAPHNWRLRHALLIARKSFAYGQWTNYLAKFGIETTRASKACAIYRSFAMIEAVGSLSVVEAYKARRRTGDNNGEAVEQRAELPVKPRQNLDQG